MKSGRRTWSWWLRIHTLSPCHCCLGYHGNLTVICSCQIPCTLDSRLLQGIVYLTLMINLSGRHNHCLPLFGEEAVTTDVLRVKARNQRTVASVLEAQGQSWLAASIFLSAALWGVLLSTLKGPELPPCSSPGGKGKPWVSELKQRIAA